MANLSETETYEAGIYRLENSDKLAGGAQGISNRQASQLANRTAWLKANGLAASQGTFAATLHMHSDPSNTTETNVTSEETGSYVRVGNMVWITLASAITQYSNHVLRHISGLPFPAAKGSVFTVGDSRGVTFRWGSSTARANRLYAVVKAGEVRMSLYSMPTTSDLYGGYWGIMNRAAAKGVQISGWYQTSAGA